jgi:hypothetical protein
MRITEKAASKVHYGVRVEGHVPFRLRMLLSKQEQTDLSEVLAFEPLEVEKEVSKWRAHARDSHRIAHGKLYRETMAYIDRDGEEQYIDVDSFCRSEFPGIMEAWGNIPPAGLSLVEFLLTEEFTIGMWGTHRVPRRKSPYAPHIIIRLDVVEYDVVVHGRAVSLAEVLLDAEKDEKAKQILAPVTQRIAECHMLDR